MWPLKGQINYLIWGVLGCMVMIICQILVNIQFPDFNPITFRFEHFLFFNGSWLDPLKTIWWLFAAGVVINGIKMLAAIKDLPEIIEDAPITPLSGFATSAFAGFFEEIVFRWVLVYAYMATLWNVNFILIKTGNTGVFPEHSAAFKAVNDALINGNFALYELPGIWTIGFAFLIANFKFQRGHMYQGPVGIIFSWFGGLAFFWVMLEHGLLAAIYAHFLFDMMVFGMIIAYVAIAKFIFRQRRSGVIYKWYHFPYLPKNQGV